MADSKSQDIIKEYSIDVDALDKRVKELTRDNEKLRQEQDKLNTAYKRGEIDLNSYKKKSAELDGALGANKKSIKDLASSLKGVLSGLGSSFSALGDLFMGPAGIATAVITMGMKVYEFFKEKEEKALEEARKKREDFLNDLSEMESERSKDRIAWLKAESKTESEAIKTRMKELRDNVAFYKEKQQEFWGTDLAANYQDMIDTANKKLVELSKQLNDVIKKENLETHKQFTKNMKSLDKLAADSEKAAQKRLDDESKKRQKLLEQEQKQREAVEKAIADLEIQLIDNNYERSIKKIKLENDMRIKGWEKLKAQTTDKDLLAFYDKAISLQNQVSKNSVTKIFDIKEKDVDRLVDDTEKLVLTLQSMKKFPDKESIDKVKVLNGQLSEQAALIRSIAYAEDEYKAKLVNDLDKEEKAYTDMYNKLLSQRNSIMESIKHLEGITDLDGADAIANKAQIEDLKANLQSTYKAMSELNVTYQNNRKVLEADTNTAIELMRVEHTKKIEQLQKEAAMTTLNTWNESLSGVSDLFSALSETQDENSRKYLKLQKASIFMSMAASLAKSISAAVEVGWPALLATVPSTIAMMVSHFAQIKSIQSQAKYADGGYVSGAGSGTSDSINAKLSNGEYVVNSNGTAMYKPILDYINSSTGRNAALTANKTSELEQMFTRAVMNMPAPVVSVESIDRQRNTIKQVDVLSKLG